MGKSNGVEKKRYGIFSLLSLIVGTVIGAGIFFKNDSVYSATNSAIISMIGWGIVSVIVIFMVICFFEISSITKKSGKVGSISSWTTSLFGNRMGKIMSYFFSFVYFPLIIASLSTYASDQLMNNVLTPSLSESSPFINFVNESVWYNFAITCGISLGIVGIVNLLNLFSRSGSKGVQSTGTVLKLMPLGLLIISVVIYLISPEIMGDNVNIPVNGLDDPLINEGWNNNDTSGILRLVFLSLPPILFAFDGFLFASNLQQEAKSKNTFRTAFVLGILIIILIYMITSFAVFSAPTIDGEGNFVFSVTSVISNLFPSQASWLPLVISILITVSIITGLNGNSVTSMRNLSSTSEMNHILDRQGNYLKRSKQLIVPNSLRTMFLLTLFWFVALRGLDVIYIRNYELNPDVASLNALGATNFGADFATVLAYLAYGIVIFGGFMNRMTKKVVVEKTPLFIPASFFAVVSSVIIASYQLYIIFDISDQIKDGMQIIDFVPIIIFGLIFFVVLISYIINSSIIKSVNSRTMFIKLIYIEEYSKLSVAQKYLSDSGKKLERMLGK